MPSSMYRQNLYFAYTPWHRRRFICSLFFVCLMVVLAACSGGPTTSSDSGTQPTSQALTPTPSPRKGPAAGTILYKADWARGIGGWEGATGWQVQHGELYSKGGAQDVLTIPFVAPTTMYAVEIHIQVSGYSAPSGGSFIFSTSHTGEIDGYNAGASGLLSKLPTIGGLHPQLQAMIDPPANVVQSQPPFDYDPRMEPHVYRLEIRDNILEFFADGVKAFTVASASSPNLSQGPLRIKSHGITLRVSSLTITAL